MLLISSKQLGNIDGETDGKQVAYHAYYEAVKNGRVLHATQTIQWLANAFV
ncbi:MAG: hypothetical protein IPP79_12680 [Chitinophagaceae bacterium]|nr:hypothetical protein [Chitinophagaceae bacterium]